MQLIGLAYWLFINGVTWAETEARFADKRCKGLLAKLCVVVQCASSVNNTSER